MYRPWLQLAAFDGSVSRDLGGRVRVVWHYAPMEGRTFDLAYRLTGLAKASDDVVDFFCKFGAKSGSLHSTS